MCMCFCVCFFSISHYVLYIVHYALIVHVHSTLENNVAATCTVHVGIILYSTR